MLLGSICSHVFLSKYYIVLEALYNFQLLLDPYKILTPNFSNLLGLRFGVVFYPADTSLL